MAPAAQENRFHTESYLMAMPVAPLPLVELPALPWNPGFGLPGVSRIYSLHSFDGPFTAEPGTVTLRATGGTYDMCGNRYSLGCQVNGRLQQILLRVAYTPVPADQPRCMAMAVDSQTLEFPVQFQQPGTFRVMGYQEAKG